MKPATTSLSSNKLIVATRCSGFMLKFHKISGCILNNTMQLSRHHSDATITPECSANDWIPFWNHSTSTSSKDGKDFPMEKKNRDPLARRQVTETPINSLSSYGVVPPKLVYNPIGCHRYINHKSHLNYL